MLRRQLTQQSWGIQHNVIRCSRVVSTSSFSPIFVIIIFSGTSIASVKREIHVPALAPLLSCDDPGGVVVVVLTRLYCTSCLSHLFHPALPSRPFLHSCMLFPLLLSSTTCNGDRMEARRVDSMGLPVSVGNISNHYHQTVASTTRLLPTASLSRQ